MKLNQPTKIYQKAYTTDFFKLYLKYIFARPLVYEEVPTW